MPWADTGACLWVRWLHLPRTVWKEALAQTQLQRVPGQLLGCAIGKGGYQEQKDVPHLRCSAAFSLAKQLQHQIRHSELCHLSL